MSSTDPQTSTRTDDAGSNRRVAGAGGSGVAAPRRGLIVTG